MEPTVNKPNGGKADFFRINFSECLKLQKVSGKEGYINKAFMNLPFQYLNLVPTMANLHLVKAHDKYFVLIDNLKRLTKSIANFKI